MNNMDKWTFFVHLSISLHQTIFILSETTRESLFSEKDLLQKKQIMDAAKEVFSQHGYSKASMDDIAKQAVKSRTTLYKYYSNKDQLLQDFIILEIEYIVTTAANAISAPSSLESKLIDYTSKKLEVMRAEFDCYAKLAADLIEGSVHAAFFREQFSRIEAVVMKAIFQKSVDQQEISHISPDQLDFLVSVITLSLRGIEHDAFCGSDDVLQEQRLQWLIGIVVRGLK